MGDLFGCEPTDFPQRQGDLHFGINRRVTTRKDKSQSIVLDLSIGNLAIAISHSLKARRQTWLQFTEPSLSPEVVDSAKSSS